ncbi:MAG: hypothetical protein IH964_12520 [Candidatus Dadabacteria bacterium]|nr:hypothetical protein [Candidatus Dadabacteria bacterium]
MNTNKFAISILTVIAILLMLITFRLYDIPKTAIAYQLSQDADVYVTGGSISIDGGSMSVTIDNPEDIAMQNSIWLDGMSVRTY